MKIATLKEECLYIAHEIHLHPFYHTHRPCSKLDVNSLTDNGFLEEPELGDLLTTKAGCLGLGRLAVSLPTMKTTFEMVGRSLGLSCTHNSPTFTHLKNSFASQVVSLNDVSIRSKGLFSFHNFHACNSLKKKKN